MYLGRYKALNLKHTLFYLVAQYIGGYNKQWMAYLKPQFSDWRFRVRDSLKAVVLSVSRHQIQYLTFQPSLVHFYFCHPDKNNSFYHQYLPLLRIGSGLTNISPSVLYYLIFTALNSSVWNANVRT